MQNKLAITLTATLSLALVGCGGGGGSTTSAPSPGTTNPPPAPVVLAATSQTAVTPTYVAGSQQMSAFTALAAFRTALNLGPVNQNTKIDKAAQNHSDYVEINKGGGTPHTEVAGNPGFTGVTVTDRLIAAGYTPTDSSEVIGWTGATGDASEVIEGLSATIYHRVIMMKQGLTDLGIAPPVIDTNFRPAYIDFGSAATKQNVAGDYVGVYPANGQTAVGLTHALESPNPFADVDVTAASFCAKTSFPISLMSQESTKLAVTSFTVTEAGQAAALDVRLVTSDTDKTGFVPQYVAFIVGKAPFKASTKYTVTFTGTANGAATGAANGVLNINKTWSFTTAAKGYRCQ